MRRAALATTPLLLAAVLAASAAAAEPSALREGGSTPIAAAGSTQAAKRSISRTRLRRGLGRELRSVGGSSGAYVYDMDAQDKRLLFSSGARSRLVPASNQKLFTTAAFLRELGGGGARLRTRVYEKGRRDGRGEHILRGNLVLVGDGDPALGMGSFARRHGLPLTPLVELARDVKRAGIGRVTGSVRADDSIFDRRRGVGATGWRAGPYLSPLSGLSFNSGFDDRGYARNPELRAARRLRELLRKRGVKVEGGVGRAELRRKALRREPLGLVRSPQAAGLISETNKPSNNFFAEMLLKRVGAGAGHRGSTVRGARKVERVAKRLGSGVHAVDGSGLGRSNRVAPRQVARLLVAMSKRGSGAVAYRKSLPVAGREGTVAHRMRGTAAQGRCRTKTGTLSGVSALSGYCEAGHGLVAFSILMNGVDVDAARRAQDHMAALIARYRR